MPVFLLQYGFQSFFAAIEPGLSLKITMAAGLANGSSAMVINLSASVVNILYNFQPMKLAGEDGTAANGVLLYVNVIFMAVYWGYSLGSAPLSVIIMGGKSQRAEKS